jgi:hypothetical protein
MALQDQLKAKGRVGIVLKDESGNVKETREVDNLVVTDGLEFIIDRMVGTSTAVMSHMQLGQGTTSPAADDDDIEDKLGTKVAMSGQTGSVTDNGTSVTYSATFAAGNGTGPVTEAAITNNGTNATGVMLCRVDFDVINKGANDSMTIEWTVSLTAS